MNGGSDAKRAPKQLWYQCLSDELSAASERLTALGNSADLDEQASLAGWVTQGWTRLILKMCRRVVPADGTLERELGDTVQALSDAIQASRFRWEKETLSMAHDALGCMKNAVQSLSQDNPKYESLRRLVEQSPRSSIFVTERDRGDLSGALSGCDVSVVSRVPGKPDHEALIVPAWYGRSRMETLISRSMDGLRLLLYEPEEQWFKQAMQRRAMAVRFAKRVGFFEIFDTNYTEKRRRPSEWECTRSIAEQSW